MMVVYAIKSLVDNRIYVGMTLNPERRLIEHNQGRTKSTKGYRPWILIFKEEVENRKKPGNWRNIIKVDVEKKY
jgi:putative endonuclease